MAITSLKPFRLDITNHTHTHKKMDMRGGELAVTHMSLQHTRKEKKKKTKQIKMTTTTMT